MHFTAVNDIHICRTIFEFAELLITECHERVNMRSNTKKKARSNELTKYSISLGATKSISQHCVQKKKKTNEKESVKRFSLTTQLKIYIRNVLKCKWKRAYCLPKHYSNSIHTLDEFI